MTLHDRASHLNCLCLLELPPCDFQKNSGVPMVHQMFSYGTSDSPADSVSAVDTSDSSPAAHQCLMCNATTHLFNACPKVVDLDSNTCRVVFAGLLLVFMLLLLKILLSLMRLLLLMILLRICVVMMLMHIWIFSRPISYFVNFY